MNTEGIALQITELVKFYQNHIRHLGGVQLATKPCVLQEAPQAHSQSVAIEDLNAEQIKSKQIPTVTNDTPSIITKEELLHDDVKKNLENIKTITQLKDFLSSVNVCEIQEFATNLVLGDGNENSKILVIGEAPGQEEDEAGIPFCGRSGKLLMNAFSSVGLHREKNFFVTNNIFWRPPGNRKPTEEELHACRPYLQKIIEILNPKCVICVGAVAAQNVLSTNKSISSLRQAAFEDKFTLSAKVFCLYHPSYLLRNPSKKYEMYKDLLYMLPHISSEL